MAARRVQSSVRSPREICCQRQGESGRQSIMRFRTQHSTAQHSHSAVSVSVALVGLSLSA